MILSVPDGACDIFMGIDPGQETGVALWDKKNQKFISISTMTFWRTIEWMYHWKESQALHDILLTVFLEDPTQNRPVWIRDGMEDRRHVKIAQDVGKNKRDAELIHEWCSLQMVECKLLVPGKNSQSKLTPESFKNITKYSGRTSQHGRDAAMLVYGR